MQGDSIMTKKGASCRRDLLCCLFLKSDGEAEDLWPEAFWLSRAIKLSLVYYKDVTLVKILINALN